jgi:hypothetical protein
VAPTRVGRKSRFEKPWLQDSNKLVTPVLQSRQLCVLVSDVTFRDRAGSVMTIECGSYSAGDWLRA